MSKSIKRKSSKEKVKSKPLTDWIKTPASTEPVQNKTNKKIYKKQTYNLGDGAKVVVIPEYVNKPNDLFAELHNNIKWRRFKYEVNGQKVDSPRLMNIIYLDDNNNLINLPNLNRILKRIEKITGVIFKYAVLNLYRHGKDHIGYHADREVSRGQIVVSVTVGATRRFVLKHKFREGVRHVFMLSHGDVMILNDAAIKGVYKHAVPKMANVGPRINITFRE